MTSALIRLKDRVSFTFPVLLVVAFSSVIVYFAMLSTITVEAVVFESEGGGGAQAGAGILNALVFILPAVIFAFVIAYLVKKRRMNVLKVFFGFALFLTTSIITFFFIILMDDLIWTRIDYWLYDPVIWEYYIESAEMWIGLYGPYPSITFSSALVFSGFVGVILASTVFSKNLKRSEKNQALLIIGGLMGSFLSFILPWWTVVPMLLALVIYDIYAVYKGPIRVIFEESQAELERGLDEKSFFIGEKEEAEMKKETTGKEKPRADKEKDSGGGAILAVEEDRRERLIREYRAKAEKERRERKIHKRQGLLGKLGFGGGDDKEDFAEDLLSSMTYGTDEWELGIGDLVFYGMLGSHTLKIGADLIPTYGILAPWIFFATTLVGILIGFFITLKLLERNVLLPGLPIPIVLGLASMGLTFLGFKIFL